MRRESPSNSSSPQTNVRRSPGVSSTTSSCTGPMRSFGPGRSCRIATGRPARAGRLAHAADGLGVLVQRAVRVVQAGNVHPGATISTSVAGSREAGPMVATILLLRMVGTVAGAAPESGRPRRCPAAASGGAERRRPAAPSA